MHQHLHEHLSAEGQTKPKHIKSFDEIRHGEPILLRAYHGTSHKEALIREGFKISEHEKNPLIDTIKKKFKKREEIDREGFLGRGVYFTDNKSLASKFGIEVIEVDVELDKPFVICSASIEDLRGLDISDIKRTGYDAIVILHGRYGWHGESYRQGVVFDPKKIKVAITPFKATTFQIGAKVRDLKTGEIGTIRDIRRLDDDMRQFWKESQGIDFTMFIVVKWHGKKNITKPRVGHNVKSNEVELIT